MAQAMPAFMSLAPRPKHAAILDHGHKGIGLPALADGHRVGVAVEVQALARTPARQAGVDVGPAWFHLVQLAVQAQRGQFRQQKAGQVALVAHDRVDADHVRQQADGVFVVQFGQ